MIVDIYVILFRFHIYLIGTEECERTIAQSAIIVSKKSWEQYLTQCLGENYVAIRAHTLQVFFLKIKLSWIIAVQSLIES